MPATSFADENRDASSYQIPKTFGDLAPIERAKQRVRDALETLRQLKGNEDDYQRALTFALSVLEPALVEARTAKLRITPRQRARIEGVQLAALYKRISRAIARGETVPGLVREGRSIYFELSIPAPTDN